MSIYLSNYDISTLRIHFVNNKGQQYPQDEIAPYKFAMFKLKFNDTSSTVILEALQIVLKTPYFTDIENNTYFMIFRIFESDIVETLASGNIQTRLRGYECFANMNAGVEVSYSILDINVDALFCHKDIIHSHGDSIFIPFASSFVRKLLTCERDLIANFNSDISLELFISNKRWQDLINKLGLMLAQKWIEQEKLTIQ